MVEAYAISEAPQVSDNAPPSEVPEKSAAIACTEDGGAAIRRYLQTEIGHVPACASERWKLRNNLACL
jgi:predicted transcriptional regulator